MNFTTLDLIGLVLVIGSGITGYIKGAINTLLGLAGFIASFLIAWLCSPLITQWILNFEPVKQFIASGITENVTKAITTQSSQILSGIQGMEGMDFLNSIIASMNTADTTEATKAVTTIMEPFIVQVTEFFVFLLLLFLCNIVFGILKRAGRGVNRVPVIGTLNRVSGFGIGVIIGGIIFYLVTSAVLYYAVFKADLAMIQIVKNGILTGPISLYIH